MPLIGPLLKTKMQATIFAALQKEFQSDIAKGGQYAADATAMHKKMAAAISEIALDIVDEITSNAMVMPGQSVVGVGGGIPGPVTANTVSPGQIK